MSTPQWKGQSAKISGYGYWLDCNVSKERPNERKRCVTVNCLQHWKKKVAARGNFQHHQIFDAMSLRPNAQWRSSSTALMPKTTKGPKWSIDQSMMLKGLMLIGKIHRITSGIRKRREDNLLIFLHYMHKKGERKSLRQMQSRNRICKRLKGVFEGNSQWKQLLWIF